MQILDKYLKKLGLKSYVELSPEEKETYRQWEASLSGRKLTDEEVSIFFKTELENTTVKLIEKNLNERQDIFLKMKLEFIRSVMNFLDSPARERIMVEKSIGQMIEKL